MTTIRKPDGELTRFFDLSTNANYRFYTGELVGDGTGLQVQIGSTIYTDESVFSLTDVDGVTNWTIPNPAYRPEGLPVISGQVISVIEGSSRCSVKLIKANLGYSTSIFHPQEIIAEPLDQGSRLIVNVLQDNTENSPDLLGMMLYEENDDGIILPISEGIVGTVGSALSTEAEQTFRFNQYVEQNTLDIDIGGSDYSFPAIPNNDYAIQISVERQGRVTTVSYDHRRTGRFASLSSESPIRYRARLVYAADSGEVLSSYSHTTLGYTSSSGTLINGLPSVNRASITQEMVKSILSQNSGAAVHPGTGLRDLIIDPTVSEVQRTRFILDFFYRAGSFDLLLEIDGGTSLTQVADSSYKKTLGQAFYMASDAAVQAVIDSAFEKLASNLGIYRLSGRRSVGDLTFFSNRAQNAPISIPAGTIISAGQTNVQTKASATLDFTTYNFNEGRYEVTVPAESIRPGSDSNIPARGVNASFKSLRVTNTSNYVGGQDSETNVNLVRRAKLALKSVDSGTASGLRSMASVAGINDAVVVNQDSPYADWSDPSYVQVYVRSEYLNQVTDPVYFIPETVTANIYPYGDPSALEFTTDVSSIYVITDFRNLDTGATFDLTGVTYISDRVFKLSSSVPQPLYGPSSVLSARVSLAPGTRSSNQLTYPHVRSLVALIGELNGPVRTATVADSIGTVSTDPLSAGLSSTFVYLQDPPSVLTIPETKEHLVDTAVFILDFSTSPCVESSLVLDGYVKGVDYEINPIESSDGSEFSQRFQVHLSSTGPIIGQIVTFSYDRYEKWSATYEAETSLIQAQRAINQNVHVTANVEVLESPSIFADITLPIVFAKESLQTSDQAIRSSIQSHIDSLTIGQSLYQSDLIALAEDVPGVSHIPLPLSQFSVGPNSYILLEPIFVDFDLGEIPEYSTPSTAVYMTTELKNKVLSGSVKYKGVRGYNTITINPDLIARHANQAFFVDEDGLDITGSVYYNRIVISVDRGTIVPELLASYETGTARPVARDIKVHPLSHIKLGRLEINAVNS